MRVSQAVGEHGWVQDRGVPTLGDLLGAVTSVGMYRYNFETIDRLMEVGGRLLRESPDFRSFMARGR